MLKSIVADVGAEPVELGGSGFEIKMCQDEEPPKFQWTTQTAKLTDLRSPMISKVQKSVDVPQIEYERQGSGGFPFKSQFLWRQRLNQIWVSQVRKMLRKVLIFGEAY